MNDETRAALVEALIEPIRLAKDSINEARQESLLPHPEIILWPSEYEYLAEAVVTACLPIIDRLLADRAVPEPEAIERAAKVLWDYRRRDTGWKPWEELRDTRPDGSAVESKPHYRDMARAALSAVPEPDADMTLVYMKGYQDGQDAAGDAVGLDELLDSVHPRAIIRSVWALRGGGWEARISVPEGPDDNGWYDYIGNESVGTGPTRIAAIQDAVKSAKEATQ